MRSSQLAPCRALAAHLKRWCHQMRTTLTVPSWFLIGLGVLITGYFAKDIQPAWLIPIGLWMLFPYWVLLKSIRAAHSCMPRVVALLATLAVVAFGFWVYFDRKFVHVSGMDNSPVEVPFVQLIVAVGSWLAVHRLQRRDGNEDQAI